MKKSIDTWFLFCTGALCGLFLLHVFLGKLALVLDNEPILSIGDVGG